MFRRSPWKALLLVGFGLALAGCTNNLVDSITVSPSTQALTVGQTVQFTATGLQTHGTHPSTNTNVTSLVTWTSSAPAVATVNGVGLATALTAGSTTITASMQGFGGVISGSAVLTVTGTGISSVEPLASLAIDPGSQTALALNQTVDFIAIGLTGANATVNLTGQSATVGTSTIKAATWYSSNPAVATVNLNTGIATALTSGTTTITAQAVNPDGTVVIGTATLTVTLPTLSPEPLVSLAIIPGTQTLTSLDQPAQFIAIGTTGTGTTINLTDKVTWTSSSPTVASINANTGLATALSNGTAAITAVATNPDGTVVTGVGAATVNIAATGEPIVSLAIVPGSQTASVVGQTAQFVAIGTTATGATVNLTNQSATVGTSTIGAAVWGTSSSAVATINSATGLASAVSSGSVAITAQAKNPDGTVVTGTAAFTVISTPEPLISLTIVPGAQTLASTGQTADFVAIGTTASGATVNLTNTKATIGAATINAATWGTSNGSVATINPATGIATAGTSGIAVITAIAYNPDGTAVTATATLTVNITATQEPLVSLSIVPATQTTSVVGQTVQFIAIGTTSAGTTVNLTNQTATIGTATIAAAVWGSSSTAIAPVSQGAGIATAASAGTVAITAQAKNPDGTVVTAAATLTVITTPEPLVSLTVVPPTQTLSSTGQTSQFVAIGTTASGATVNLTNAKATIGAATINAATWASSSVAVASINAVTGLATAGTSGSTVITAIAYNPDGTAVTGTATLTANISATQEPLVSLAIVPASQTASVVGQTAQYIAIGTTSSGATVNLTGQSATVGTATINAAVWGSSSVAIATVNPASGLATAVSTGTVAITAQAKNPDGSVVTAAATFTVITAPEPLVSLTIVPSTQTLVTAGETTQYIAIGTTATGATVNLTNVKASINGATINAATWASSTSGVASINANTGIAAAVTSGTTVITAVAYNPDGTAVTGTATLTVNLSATQEPLVSLTIIPATQTTSVVGQTVQFIALGTTSSGATVNLTNQPAIVGTVTIPNAVWTSSSAAIATVGSGTGVATAVSTGTVAISAQAKNPDGTVVTGQATFTIIATPEPLISLSIVPATQTLATVGEPVHYIAIGTTASGATVNLTGVKANINGAIINPAAWASSSPNIASIDPNTGIAAALTSGTTVITAIAYNPDGTAVTATATLTVDIAATQEPLVSLAIIPATQTASVFGQAVDFIAIGTTSSGTTVNLTTQSATVNGATVSAAFWASSSPAVASIVSNTGVATAVSSGTIAITAQARNPDGTVVTGTATLTVTPTPEPLVSIAIVPATQTLVTAGETTQYIAIGTTSTGATVNLTAVTANINGAIIQPAAWASSTASIATIDPVKGLAKAVTSGVTIITAVASNPDGTVVTGTATLNVNLSATPEPLVSLAVVPITQTASVVGQTVNFIAIGTTSSGATVNLTTLPATVNGVTVSAAAWSSSSTAVASIVSNTGVATAVGTGTVAITAQATNPDGTVVTGTASLTVISTPEPLISLAIVPATQTASVVGQTAQYIVIGTTSTGATVNLTNQSATVNGATIKAAVWNSSIQQIATIDQTGLAKVPTGAVNGVTVITAVATNPDGTAVTATATLTVNITATSEPLVSLAIFPGTQTTSVVGQTVQYLVIGTTSTGSTVNLTNQSATIGLATINAALWGSSSAAIATIDKNTGLATTVGAGTVAITAVAYNPDGTAVTGTAVLTVSSNPEPLVSLAIVPASQTLTIAGQTAQFIAIGTTSSGATVNLTSSSATIGGAKIGPVVWGSSLLSVATVGTTGVAGSTPGLAVAGTTGVTAITATASNPDGTAVVGASTLSVSSGIPGPIVSVAVVPTAQFGFSVYENPLAQFAAIGTTSTGTTVNLTSQQVSVGSATVQPATWSSSNPTIATTNPGGIISPVSTGATAISAAVPNSNGAVTGTASYTSTATGSTEPIVAINISPAVPAPLTGGGTVTLTATGISGALGTVASPTVVWASSNPGVATVNAGTGVVNAVGPGVTAITATATNPDNTMPAGVVVITVTSPVTVTSSIASITVIPGTQGVAAPNDTAQFIAIGTTTTGATVNLTNQVAWSISSSSIGTITGSAPLSGAVATGTGPGTATITALYTPGGGGNVVTGTAQFTVEGGTTEEYTAVNIIPNGVTLAEGEFTQFVAVATLGTSGLLVDVTNSPQIKWSSNLPGVGIPEVGGVASVSTPGLVQGLGAGTATITAELSNPDNTVVTASAGVTVTNSTTPEPLLSLTIIPGNETVGNLQASGQFLAIGTFSTAPFVQDLTNSPNTTWISSFPDSFPVSTNSGGTPSASAGIVTAYTSGSATIIAEYQNPNDKTIQTATATFNCPLALPNPNGDPPTPGTCNVGETGPLKSTLTIYGEGLNTTNWLVTAPSATATPDVIHCGPGWNTTNNPADTGGSVCTGIYPVGTTVLLTAPAQTGVNFGGWTYNCTPSDVNGVALPGPVFYTAAGPNYCTITLIGISNINGSSLANATVGAIFN